MSNDPGGISTPASLDHRAPGPQLDDLTRRLRAWSSSSWAHGDRLAATRRELQRLADDAAVAAGREQHSVPQLAPTAIPDQLMVLVTQAQDDGIDPAPAVTRIAEALGFSR